MPDAFGKPVNIGDHILIAYRASGGPLIVEPREVVYVSASGAPYYYTTHTKESKAGRNGPQLRAAKEPIYVVRT